jgi:hypothetical protein
MSIRIELIDSSSTSDAESIVRLASQDPTATRTHAQADEPLNASRRQLDRCYSHQGWMFRQKKRDRNNDLYDAAQPIRIHA